MEVNGQFHTSDAFFPVKDPSNGHLVGNWVGFRAGVDIIERKHFCPCRDSNPTACLFSRQPGIVGYLTTLSELHHATST
jgi:hypothetical protein